MSLGQANVVLVKEKRAVEVSRRRQSQGAEEKKLPGGALEKIGAADHFRDLHGRIIRHHRQLIGGNVIAAPDQEIREILARGEALLSATLIFKSDGFSVRNAKPPADASGRIPPSS